MGRNQHNPTVPRAKAASHLLDLLAEGKPLTLRQCVEALTSMGVPRKTAYRWSAKVLEEHGADTVSAMGRGWAGRMLVSAIEQCAIEGRKGALASLVETYLQHFDDKTDTTKTAYNVFLVEMEQRQHGDSDGQ